MSEANRDKAFDHDFDGIREYDNPLPFWWVGLFWATIVFSAFYIVYYHFGPGPTVEDEHKAGMSEIYDLQLKELLKMGPISDDMIVKMAADPGRMGVAQATFASKCSPCHAGQAQGNIGPNLTDDFWIHGGHPTEIYRTISEGVPSKGMLSWKNQLSAGEMLALAAYVTTLRGTNPPNAKKAEGDRFDPAKPTTFVAPGGPGAKAAGKPGPAAAPQEAPPDFVARPMRVP